MAQIQSGANTHASAVPMLTAPRMLIFVVASCGSAPQLLDHHAYGLSAREVLLTGRLFGSTKLQLTKRFLAIYFISPAKTGLSALEPRLPTGSD